jgi:hypothetical protein
VRSRVALATFAVVCLAALDAAAGPRVVLRGFRGGPGGEVRKGVAAALRGAVDTVGSPRGADAIVDGSLTAKGLSWILGLTVRDGSGKVLGSRSYPLPAPRLDAATADRIRREIPPLCARGAGRGAARPEREPAAERPRKAPPRKVAAAADEDDPPAPKAKDAKKPKPKKESARARKARERAERAERLRREREEQQREAQERAAARRPDDGRRQQAEDDEATDVIGPRGKRADAKAAQARAERLEREKRERERREADERTRRASADARREREAELARRERETELARREREADSARRARDTARREREAELARREREADGARRARDDARRERDADGARRARQRTREDRDDGDAERPTRRRAARDRDDETSDARDRRARDPDAAVPARAAAAPERERADRPDVAAARAVPPPGRGAASIGAGVAVATRHFELSPHAPSLPVYDAPFYPVLVLTGDVYPFAFFTSGRLGDLGLTLRYERVLGLSSQEIDQTTGDVITHENQSERIEGGLTYRLQTGASPLAPVLRPSVAVGRHTFALGGGSAMPDTAYTYVALGLGLFVPVATPSFGVAGGLRYYIVTGLGQVGDFGSTWTAWGLELNLGLRLYLARALELSVGYAYEQVEMTYQGIGHLAIERGITKPPSSGSDVSHGARAGVAWHF